MNSNQRYSRFGESDETTDHNVDRGGGRLLTVKEVARRLDCSQTNVYSLISRGMLPVICVGKSKGYRIDADDLSAFLDERRVRYETAKPTEAPRSRLKHLDI